MKYPVMPVALMTGALAITILAGCGGGGATTAPTSAQAGTTRAAAAARPRCFPDCRGKIIENTNLIGVDLSFGDFRYASLKGSGLMSARLVGTNLAGADLRFANLAYAQVTPSTNLTGVRWGDTTCPDRSITDTGC